LISLLAILLVAGFLYANPFFGGSSNVAEPRVEPGRSRGAGDAIATLQQRLSEGLADFIATAEGSPVAAALIAVAYGFVHAIGPGHRKTVILTYFGTQPATIPQAVLVGAAVAAMHFASTVTVTYGAYYIVRAAVMASTTATISVLTASSYAFVTAAGALLLYLALRDWVGGHGNAEGPETPVSHSGRGRRRGPATVILSALAPCPGASMVAILSLSMGRPGFGVAAVMAMSVGTAGVTVPIAALATAGRAGLVNRLPRHGVVSDLLHHGLETAGGAILVVFGVLMLYPYLADLA
jgi:ABC-type nickel/cobalt efflux system permease component RcnA